MTMISDLIPVTLIYDPTLGSPTELAPLANQILLVPADMMPLPARGTVFGQPGYARTNPTTSANEWVMTGQTDPLASFVDSITGKGGWTNQQARTVIATLVQRLFSAGIPRGTISTQVPQMYQAVVAEVLAEQAAGLL